jgi:predicted nucleic acid-binding protein
MKTLYVETSAILTWLFNEQKAKSVIKEINKESLLVSSSLIFVEVERALIRAEKQNILMEIDCQKLRGLFAHFKATFLIMEISEEVKKRASESFPIEPVRTLDAIHLATALTFAKVYQNLKVLSFDKRITNNCEALGIKII